MKKNNLCAIVVLLSLLLSVGCTTQNNSPNSSNATEASCFQETATTEKKTSTFTIEDKKGTVLFSYDYYWKAPKTEQITENIVKVSLQTGTGLSTNWSVFCDIENSKVSETFMYVLMAQEDYVIYVAYENGEHSIIVQDIFDKTRYYKKYVLENCAPVAADIVTGAKANGEGFAIITYLTGEDYKETELTIRFPSPTKKTTLPDTYDTIINNIINAFPWSDDDVTMVPENPELSYMYRHNSELSDIGFTLVDLDNNGQDELIISDVNQPFIYDLYTISGGEAVHLADSGERSCYYLLENGYLECQWSGSAATNGHDFYKLDDGELDFVERITLDAYHALDVGLINNLSAADGYNCYFQSKSEQSKDYVAITSDEAVKAIESHQTANKPLNVAYTLLSEYEKQ